MIFNNRSISEITDQELKDLIGNQKENLWIDFKEKPYQRDPDDSEKYKREICKDVTAMANADGGYILIGVSEKNKLAKAFITVLKPDSVVKSIRGICQSHIDLPILNLEVDRRDFEWNGNHVTLVIIHIPSSKRAPHGFQSKGTTNYVIRDGDNTREYRHSELIEAIVIRYHLLSSVQSNDREVFQSLSPESGNHKDIEENANKVVWLPQKSTKRDDVIDYLVPSYLINGNPEMPTSASNPSGGLRTKIFSVKMALRDRYHVNICDSVETCEGNLLLIEPHCFHVETDRDQEAKSQLIQEIHDHEAVKILYCSGIEVLRWSGNKVNQVAAAIDAITGNSTYLLNLLKGLDINKPYIMLIDPVDENFFRPTTEKQLDVVAMGLVSRIKNTEFIVELFQALQGTPIRTVYLGNASLWGNAIKSNDLVWNGALELEEELRDVTDLFIGGATRSKVAEILSEASIYVGNTLHGTYVASQVESLMSGCLSITGHHLIYSERPGITGLKSVPAFVSTIQNATDNFQEVPLRKTQDESRTWALKHCSFARFREQLSGIRTNFL